MANYKGVNYIGRQRKEEICVAISIINALKWAGNKNITSKHIDYVYKKAGNPGDGTDKNKVMKVLKIHCKKHLNVVYKKHSTGAEVIEWLKQGHSVILDYFCNKEKDDEIGHSIFIAGLEKNSVVIINDFCKPMYKMNIKRFKKELFKKTIHYPGVYFLRKKNDS